MQTPYTVNAALDADALAWLAASDAVPGLATEAATLEALDAKLRLMVPELLEANGCLPAIGRVRVDLVAIPAA